MAINSITGIIPTMQSVTLLRASMPKKKKKITKTAIELIVGLELMKATARHI